MGLLNYFRSSRKGSAAVAKERLQILVAQERTLRQGPDFLPLLKQEILAVIAKYVEIDQDQVQVNLDREGDYEVLELNITLPEGSEGEPDKS